MSPCPATCTWHGAAGGEELAGIAGICCWGGSASTHRGFCSPGAWQEGARSWGAAGAQGLAWHSLCLRLTHLPGFTFAVEASSEGKTPAFPSFSPMTLKAILHL